MELVVRGHELNAVIIIKKRESLRLRSGSGIREKGEWDLLVKSSLGLVR